MAETATAVVPVAVAVVALTGLSILMAAAGLLLLMMTILVLTAVVVVVVVLMPRTGFDYAALSPGQLLAW